MLDLPQNLVSSLAKYGRKLAQDESNSREEDADVAVRTAFAEKDGERERERETFKRFARRNFCWSQLSRFLGAYIKLVKKPVSDKFGICKQPECCTLIPSTQS